LDINFVQKGTLCFILPRQGNACYYKVHQGDIIGLEDYIYNLTQEGESLRHDKQIPLHLFEADDYGRRRFTVIAEKQTTVNKLSIFEFQKTLIEFPEFAEKLIKLQAS
jgi:CRP-like cAMP-binding protein